MIDFFVAQVDNAFSYVIAAYTIVLGGLFAFLAWLGVRLRRARRELDQLL